MDHYGLFIISVLLKLFAVHFSTTTLVWVQQKPEVCYEFRIDSKCTPSQWETALLCNDVLHWLCASLKSALEFHQYPCMNSAKATGYSDVIMRAMASQITGVSIVFSTVCSDADQRNHQSSAPLAFVRGIHRWSVNSPHKWPVTRKMFPLDDAIVWFQVLAAWVTDHHIHRRHWRVGNHPLTKILRLYLHCYEDNITADKQLEHNLWKIILVQ